MTQKAIPINTKVRGNVICQKAWAWVRQVSLNAKFVMLLAFGSWGNKHQTVFLFVKWRQY